MDNPGYSGGHTNLQDEGPADGALHAGNSFRLRPGLVLSVVALLLLLFFARWWPHQSLSALVADSSIFLYIGQQANDGLTPYVDAWEDKPPLIFWLNAFAIRFTPNSARGTVC